jgi:multisubunit Na+/H+ antiporter MnhF subunit
MIRHDVLTALYDKLTIRFCNVHLISFIVYNNSYKIFGNKTFDEVILLGIGLLSFISTGAFLRFIGFWEWKY